MKITLNDDELFLFDGLEDAFNEWRDLEINNYSVKDIHLSRHMTDNEPNLEIVLDQENSKNLIRIVTGIFKEMTRDHQMDNIIKAVAASYLTRPFTPGYPIHTEWFGVHEAPRYVTANLEPEPLEAFIVVIPDKETLLVLFFDTHFVLHYGDEKITVEHQHDKDTDMGVYYTTDEVREILIKNNIIKEVK